MNYQRLFPIMRSPYKPANRIKPELPWWVEIVTAKPKCVYYFGPFDSQREATETQSGYIKDLIEEKATGISIKIKQDRPKILTISE